MALGFTTLRNEALKLLNETNTSVVGELATGTGQGYISATITLGNAVIVANNNFSAGDQVKFLASTVTNVVAGTIYTVSSTGLSSTQFQITDGVTGITPSGGTGGTFTVVSAAIFSDRTILDYINEAAAEMCRTCCFEQKTYTAGAATSNRITNISSTNIWFPIHVGYSIYRLIHCGEPELRNYDLNYDSTFGVPKYWYKSGQYNIGIYPVQSSPITLQITGACIVDPITISNGTYSFIPDDLLLKTIPAYVAGKLAMKNFDDPSLVGRSFWKDWYDNNRMLLWAQLDGSLKAIGGPFAIPPVPQASK